VRKLVFNRVLVCTAIIGFSVTSLGAQEARTVSSPAAPFAAGTTDQQSNVPAQVRQAEADVERAAKRFRLGVAAGVGVDPELILFGAHVAVGPLFARRIDLRPGIEFGVGEVTTTMGVNLDVLYTLPGVAGSERWSPYIGGGPNFALSHVGFDSADEDDDGEDRNRFDFGDTDFEGGVNFIAGARSRNGMFIEMKATAYGVSNVRLLAGFNF
jgi:hypothetical protein